MDFDQGQAMALFQSPWSPHEQDQSLISLCIVMIDRLGFPTGPGTSEYHLVKVAEQSNVSGSYLARICSVLHVPRPARGYWAKLAVGRAIDVERFLQGVQERASELPAEERSAALIRLDLAHKFIGSQNPLDFFLSWKTPLERYRPVFAWPEDNRDSAGDDSVDDRRTG